MKFLLVIAHPDDEVLGAGASIHKWTQEGHEVEIAILCPEAQARSVRPEDDDIHSDTEASLKMLGVKKKYTGDFPNIEINSLPHIKIVQFIESAIMASEPDIIITHHLSDTNNDHLQTSLACQEAIRIFQRREDVKRIREVWFMEIPSSTEWKINSGFNGFNPNCFVEVGKEGIDAKIKALSMYRGVMRQYPHPRSVEYITSLATVRGSQWKLNYAEAFEVVMREYCAH